MKTLNKEVQHSAVMNDNPDSSVFVQAVTDSINTWVFSQALGRDVKTPHRSFIDNFLMAKIRQHILTYMAASIKSLLLCMGQVE